MSVILHKEGERTKRSISFHTFETFDDFIRGWEGPYYCIEGHKTINSLIVYFIRDESYLGLSAGIGIHRLFHNKVKIDEEKQPRNNPELATLIIEDAKIQVIPWAKNICFEHLWWDAPLEIIFDDTREYLEKCMDDINSFMRTLSYSASLIKEELKVFNKKEKD